MAIELNNRTKILAGVVLLIAAGAAAWFFFLEDFLSEPAKPPAAKSAPAEASKQAGAGKAGADAPKAAATAAAPAKGAAPAPGAKPIPSNPDKLIAEVIDLSGVTGYYPVFAREALVRSGVGDPGTNQAGYASVTASVSKAFEPAQVSTEIAANLKASGFDAERMARFLEVLRQPIALKMNAADMRDATPDAVKEHIEASRKTPLPAERVKLLQALDELTKTSEVGAELNTALSRELIDAAIVMMKKAGKGMPQESRDAVNAQLNSLRNQGRNSVRTVLYVMYRKASDAEIAEYLKLLDTDTGRWGMEQLADAARPALVSRGGTVGREMAEVATASMAKKPAAEQSAAKEETPAEKPAAAPVAAAAVAAPGYRRPANIRDVYTRYNDLVSATVMRDRAAVKELLDDGKDPNSRQSDGLTPLMIAASNGDTEIATMLLGKGADPNLRAGGRSALSIAKSRGSAGAATVQLLERSGAKN